MSSTLVDPGWNGAVVAGDAVERITALRRELAGPLLVYGSPTLVRTLLEHELVDELRLVVYPVALGAGERLFDGLSAATPLRLADLRTVGDGIAVMTYRRRAGADRPAPVTRRTARPAGPPRHRR